MSLFFVVTVASIQCMELVTESGKKSIHRKALHGFLLGKSLIETRALSENWTVSEKETIREKIFKPKHKYLSLLFDIGTKLPPEVQAIIVRKFLNDNEKGTNNFLNMPLREMLTHYNTYSCVQLDASLYGPISNQITFESLIQFCDVGRFFQYLKECKCIAKSVEDIPLTIDSLDKLLKNEDVTRTREELEKISTLVSTLDQESKKINDFAVELHRELKDRSIVTLLYEQCDKVNKASKKFKKTWVTYNFYESYTLSNFIKHQDIKQLLLLSYVLAPFFSKYLERNFCTKYLDVTIVKENKMKEALNLFLKNKCEETGDRCWLSLVQKIRNPHQLRTFSRIAWLSPFFIGAFNSLYYLWQMGSKKVSTVEFHTDFGLFLGHLVLLLFTCISFDELSETFLQGMMCVTGVYAVLCSLASIIKMRSMRDDHVVIAGNLSNLSSLLQRTDIYIP